MLRRMKSSESVPEDCNTKQLITAIEGEEPREIDVEHNVQFLTFPEHTAGIHFSYSLLSLLSGGIGQRKKKLSH